MTSNATSNRIWTAALVVIAAWTSATTRTSDRRMPCTLSQVAICAMFRSWVRPDKISSPITTSAAVQIRLLVALLVT